MIVDVADGMEVATSVCDYASGDKGILLDPKDPNLARQNSADYIDGFYQSVRAALRAAKKQPGFSADQVIGIGVDTTGSTPIPVDRDGTPLAMQARFKKNLAAHAWLWKDHTSHAEAAEITDRARRMGLPYLAKCGGTYSSEWYWSKILHCKRTSPQVFAAAYGWVELADFVDKLTPGDLVEVDLASGEVVGSKLRPSVDLPHHLYLYRNMPGVGSIIHTHGNHATAFAAIGRPIPLCLTAIADQFGAEIPCTPYVDNEADHIGQMILKHRNRGPAILLQNHGVFAWGTSPRDALKAAVMTEDVAKTVHLALQLGQPRDIPADEAKKWYDRYHHGYGQPGLS